MATYQYPYQYAQPQQSPGPYNMLSHDEPRQHQYFDVIAEHQPMLQTIDADIYQRHHAPKHRSQLSQSLPPPINQNKMRAHHRPRISNQEPITKFKQLNAKRQKQKLKHIGVAMPSQTPQPLKYINHSSVASRRDSSFSLGPNKLLTDGIMKGMSSKTIIVNDNQSDDDTDVESMDDDAEFVYDDDAVTETSMQSRHTMQSIPTNENNVHCSSISNDLNAYQMGQKKLNNIDIQKSPKSTTMPRSSLALMNSKLSNNKGKLSFVSVCLFVIFCIQSQAIHSQAEYLNDS